MRWKRMIGTVATAFGVAVAVLPAGQADAMVTLKGGTTGAVVIGEPSYCKHNTNGSTTLRTGAVRVSAPRGITVNVRQHSFLIANGDFAQTGAWSRSVRVPAGRAVVFPGATYYSNWRVSSRIGYLTEFYNTRGRKIGTTMVTSDRYNFFNVYNAGPFGPISACRKI